MDVHPTTQVPRDVCTVCAWWSRRCILLAFPPRPLLEGRYEGSRHSQYDDIPRVLCPQRQVLSPFWSTYGHHNVDLLGRNHGACQFVYPQDVTGQDKALLGTVYHQDCLVS